MAKFRFYLVWLHLDFATLVQRGVLVGVKLVQRIRVSTMKMQRMMKIIFSLLFSVSRIVCLFWGIQVVFSLLPIFGINFFFLSRKPE